MRLKWVHFTFLFLSLFSILLSGCAPNWNASTAAFLADEPGRVDPYFVTQIAGGQYSEPFYDSTRAQFKVVLAQESDSIVIGIIAVPLQSLERMRLLDGARRDSTGAAWTAAQTSEYFRRQQQLTDAQLASAYITYSHRNPNPSK